MNQTLAPSAPVNVQWVDLVAPDGGHFKAYLALPPAPAGVAAKGAGVLLLQEIFGVNRHIRAVAEQYALDGYVALAPDVFWRLEPDLELGYGGPDIERGRALKARLDLELTLRDLGRAAQWLGARTECTGRVASIGYCMGGLLSYLCAAGSVVNASVCYYAGGVQGYLDKAASIRCPIQMHFAAADLYLPRQLVEQVREALGGRPDVEVHWYEGADHGFNCWDRAAYHATSAALAHGRTLQFLAGALAG